MNVRIEYIPPIPVARICHIGPYDKIACFTRLADWVVDIGALLGQEINLSHDNPETVTPNQRRSDACLNIQIPEFVEEMRQALGLESDTFHEIQMTQSPPFGILLETLPGGRFAVYTHHGPYEDIAAAYRHLFQEWLPQSGEKPDEAPCREIYLNRRTFFTPPDELLTDLCLPLKSPNPN